MLGQPPVVDDQPVTRVFDALPIKTSDFTMTELWEAIISTQGRRRLDSMVIQQGYGSLNVSMISYLKCVTEPITETYISDMWLKGAILPFPKKGDLGSASNRRGITLMAVGAKIYIRMLLDRLRPHIDPKLRITRMVSEKVGLQLCKYLPCVD